MYVTSNKKLIIWFVMNHILYSSLHKTTELTQMEMGAEGHIFCPMKLKVFYNINVVELEICFM